MAGWRPEQGGRARTHTPLRCVSLAVCSVAWCPVRGGQQRRKTVLGIERGCGITRGEIRNLLPTRCSEQLAIRVEGDVRDRAIVAAQSAQHTTRSEVPELHRAVRRG